MLHVQSPQCLRQVIQTGDARPFSSRELRDAIDADLPAQLACPRPVDGAIDDDAMQPRTQRAPAVEPVQRADGRKEGFLGDVLRGRRVASDQQRRPVGIGPVAREQLFDGLLGPTLSRAHQRRVASLPSGHAVDGDDEVVGRSGAKRVDGLTLSRNRTAAIWATGPDGDRTA